MPDLFDRAQQTSEQLLGDALDSWQRCQEQRPGRTHCIDCDEEIPQRRREAVPHCQRCMNCQGLFERGGKI